MPKESKFFKKIKRLIGIYILVLLSVMLFSEMFLNMRGRKEELPPMKEKIYFGLDMRMSLKKFAKKNKIPKAVALKVFNPPLNNMNMRVSKIIKLRRKNFDEKQIVKELRTAYKKYKNREVKNWKKIFAKFALWILLIIFMIFYVRKGKLTVKTRRILYGLSFVLFGVIFGGDPSPMGTVKDAVTAFGLHGRLYWPRFVALGVFLTMVIVANKSICAWGCPFGTLQDFLFRFNRDKRDQKSSFKQFKLPFIFTNSVRIIVFAAMLFFALAKSVDILEPVNPFSIFSPYYMSAAGLIFVPLLLFIAFFVYRPWCTMFCPFGLMGWIAEKFSVLKIKVDYDKCVSCDVCSKACPTTTMEAILKRKTKVIPDCFACMNCMESCPVEAIEFGAGKRQKPPKDKFSRKKKK